VEGKAYEKPDEGEEFYYEAPNLSKGMLKASTMK
jgi:hypothetical protein